jgi:hypothetical protein
MAFDKIIEYNSELTASTVANSSIKEAKILKKILEQKKLNEKNNYPIGKTSFGNEIFIDDCGNFKTKKKKRWGKGYKYTKCL